MAEKLPYFKFYPKDYMIDEFVQIASNAALGCYQRLLCMCWAEGSIPSDLKTLAALCREEYASFKEIWENGMGRKFVQSTNLPERLIHPRLEKERKQSEEFSEKQSENGKKGGRPKKELVESKEVKTQKNPSLLETKPNEKNLALENKSLAYAYAETEPETENKQQQRAREEDFLDFARKTHQEALASPLPERHGDLKRLEAPCKAHPRDFLEACFEFFLRWDDKWVRGKPRNIAIFVSQLPNLLDGGRELLKRRERERIAVEEKARDAPPPGLSPVQEDIERWDLALESLRQDVPRESFETWIDPLKLVGFQNGHVFVHAPNRYYKSCIDENYRDEIEAEIAKAYGKTLKVKITCD